MPSIFVHQNIEGGFITPVGDDDGQKYAWVRMITLEARQVLPLQSHLSHVTIILHSGAARDTTADGQSETFVKSGDSLMVPPGDKFYVGPGKGQTVFLVIQNPSRGVGDEIVISKK